MNTTATLPFGKHQGRPLPEVPPDYLKWLLRACKLSSGLRDAVAGELQSRGLEAPPQAPPRPVAPCRDHPGAGVHYRWQEDRAGRKHIRAECASCHRFLTFPPVRPAYTGLADAASSAAPILDALTGLEDVGAQLRSDGRGVWIGVGYKRVPPKVRDALAQAKHQLATMIGDNRQESPR
jgi:hypothetical protein